MTRMAELLRSSNPASADLVSFVPRLTLEWLRDDPEPRWLELDGTLAFVDISGFTAMSERLSQPRDESAQRKSPT